MRRLAYFINNYLSGIGIQDAWQKSGEETQADKPKWIDYGMGWDEFDDWPYRERKLYDTSHRKTIWQILSR